MNVCPPEQPLLRENQRYSSFHPLPKRVSRSETADPFIKFIGQKYERFTPESRESHAS